MQDRGTLTDVLHSVLEPLGVHSQHIDLVWQVMLWVCGAMYLVVLAFLAWALWRRARRDGQEINQTDEHAGMARALIGWAMLIVAGLFALTLTSFLADRALLHAASERQLAIKITANQWWWDVEYLHQEPGRRVRSANEIHLPVDAQVHIELASNDVIHSFWVPNLHGKLDLIPGRATQIRLQPRQIGTYRGQCAEFCGLQHAYMAFEVIIHSQRDFDAWQARQLTAAPEPRDPLTQHGQQVFLDSACVLCHAISGTQAAATVGPDLSHVASRRMLAAGRLVNNSENLRGWIVNPQALKPGSHMPVVNVQAQDLEALVAYLGSLQ